MKTELTLFIGLILAALPLFSVTANEEAPPEAASLFAARCAMCHQLPEPSMLKPKQWTLIIDTMQQRMQQANMPQLPAQEKAMILQYLTAHARQ